MRLRSTGVIGVVAGAVTNPFYPELVEALHAAISSHGKQMSLWIASEGPQREAGEREDLRQHTIGLGAKGGPVQQNRSKLMRKGDEGECGQQSIDGTGGKRGDDDTVTLRDLARVMGH